MKPSIIVIFIFSFCLYFLHSIVNIPIAFAQSCGICNGSTGGKSCPGRDGNSYVMPAFTHSCWTPPYNGVDDCNTCCNPGVVDAPCTLVGGGGGTNPPPPPPPPPPTYPDFVPLSINTTDANGYPKTVFHTGDPIYVTTTISNEGDDYPGNDSYHAIYKSTADFHNGNEIMTIHSYSDWPPQVALTYSSWNSDRFDRDYFTQNNANTYGLWIAADYTNRVTEWSDDNNYLSNTYEVRAHLYGSVCWSQNEDTTCDPGEPGVEGIKISGTRNGSSIGSDTTDANGNYDFNYQPAGDYALTFSSNSWRTLNTNPRTTTLGPNTRIRFTAIKTYDIGGTIFIDDNRDGQRQGSETNTYPNATVTLTGPSGEGGTTTTDANGSYSFPNRKRGNYTITLTVPSGYRAYPNKDNTRSITIPLNSTQNSWRANIGINQVYNLTGRVYVDADKSRSYDAAKDMPLPNLRVNVTGHETGSDTTDAQGRYSVVGLEPGDYTVSPTLPNDYIFISSSQNNVTITDAHTSGGNFRLFGKYLVNGNIFIDNNEDNSKNNNENNYLAAPGITVTNLPANTPIPLITSHSDGSYIVSGLITKQYKINYTSLPIGYVINNPRNGPPPNFNTTVGSNGCSISPSAPDAACNSGSLINVNFAIKAGQPWWQAYGLDVRMDTGIRNPIPPDPDAACRGAYAAVSASSPNPGILFTGNVNPYFWQGDSSSTDWVIGGSSYPELHKNKNAYTSYAALTGAVTKYNVATRDLATICPDLSQCTLPASLTNGVYLVNGNLILSGFTFPANKDYIFLINGDLTITGRIRVPTSSTATFSTAGNIIVSPNVGSAAVCPAPVIGQGDLEGFYSSDKNFTILSNANCAATPATSDLQLNLQGTVVVNAAHNGGSLINNRDLCTDNVNFPTYTFRERPDMILNAPDLLRISNYNYQEIAP